MEKIEIGGKKVEKNEDGEKSVVKKYIEMVEKTELVEKKHRHAEKNSKIIVKNR